MAQLTLPAEPAYKRTSYSELKGVDFSVDPALVDKRHSPDALNMISDEGGNPIKRKGFKLLSQAQSPAVPSNANGYVQNLWSFVYRNKRFIVYTSAESTKASVHVVDENGSEYVIRHDMSNVPYAYVENGKRIGFYTEITTDSTGFYIVSYNSAASANYLRIIPHYSNGNYGFTYLPVTPKVPTIIIGRQAGTKNGGGVVYEDINLLTRERVEQFYTAKSNSNYYVTSTIDTSQPVALWYMSTTTHDWAAASSSTIAVSGSNHIVWAAPSDLATVEGEDNVKIKYSRTGTNYASRVTNCEVFARTSGATSEQLFFSGNPSYPNAIYYSAPNDPSYFPDLNYVNIGGETKIMGFCNLGENLGVIKEPASNDATLFVIYQTSLSTQAVSVVNTAANTTTTNTKQIQTFAIKRTAAGLGAISKYAISTLNDEPLFFSKNGVYGIVSQNITSEKVMRNRSRFLNAKLEKETLANKKAAVATTWNNYYVLALNGSGRTSVTDLYIEKYDQTGAAYWAKVDEIPSGYDGPTMSKTYYKPTGRLYLLDGRHKTNDQSGNTNYGYEAYYWEGISARSICAFEDTLLFGGRDGRVYVFKDTGGITDYSDEYYVTTVVTEDGESTTTTAWEQYPIVARWSTPNDNDGMSEYFKTMQKKGTMCTTAPYAASSVKVYISADSADPEYLGMVHLDVSDIFQAVDFTRLSFDPRTGPRDVFFKKKKKKYIRLRIILENNALNEPFGVYEIVKTYVLQRYAKGYTLRK